MGLDLLKNTLKKFSLEEAFEVERRDRQYKALEKLHRAIRNDELFFKLVLINALLSYQLPTRGENYWENFAGFFSEGKTVEDFEEFLRKYNNRFLSGKLKRLKKVKKTVEKLTPEGLEKFCKNPAELLRYLSERLSQPPTAKTLVFAVKMFIYACRAAGRGAPVAPFDMDIPLDVRLKKISPSREFWKRLAKEVGIPPLHLDAIVWTTLGGNEKFFDSFEDKDLKEKLKRLKEVLEKLTG